MHEPLLQVRREDQRLIAQGDAVAAFGTPLPRLGGQRPDGIHAGWRWDGHTLEAWTDFHGFFPLFYHATDTQLTLSPSLTALTERLGLRELDIDAMSVFFHLGFMLDEDTPLRHVKTLPADGRLTWDGTLRVQGQQYLGGAPIDCPRDAAIDQFIELFEQAVQRRLVSDNILLPISGGKDSRHILLALHKLGAPLRHAFTAHGIAPKTTDAEPARRLCEAVQVPHRVIDMPEPFSAHWRKNLVTHFCADEHAWFMAVHDHLAGQNATAFDGIAGSATLSASFQNPEILKLYREGRWEAIARTLLRRDVTLLKRVLPAGMIRDDAEAYVLDRICKLLPRYEAAVNPMTMFYFWNRTRREIALQAFGVLRGVAEVMCPYVDQELFAFTTSLAPQMTFDGEFHRQAIHRAYPQFADVPYAGGSAPKRLTVLEHADFVRRVAEYALKDDAGWWRTLPHLAAQWSRCVLDSRYRAAHKYLSPPIWLYVSQLEQLRQGRLPDELS